MDEPSDDYVLLREHSNDPEGNAEREWRLSSPDRLVAPNPTTEEEQHGE